MADEKLTRRKFLERVAVGALTLTAGGYLVACDQKSTGQAAASLDCTDTSGLTDAEKKTREALVYVDNSPHPDKTCDNCALWQPGDGKGCGGCTVVKGPIHPKGYCNSWAAQAT